MYNIIFLSRLKNGIMPFEATWMGLEIIILSEVSQKETNIIWYHLYAESKSYKNETYLQNRNRLTGLENEFVVGEVRIDWDFGIDVYTLLHLRIDNPGSTAYHK